MENVFYLHTSASFIFPENDKKHRNKTKTQKLLRNIWGFLKSIFKQKSSCCLRGDEGEDNDGGMLFGVLLGEGT